MFKNLGQDKVASFLGMGSLVGLGVVVGSFAALPILVGVATLATCVTLTEKLSR